MNVRKSLAAAATGALVAGAALVALAAPASAQPQGPELDGNIYWFNTVGPLADQTAATQITTGTGTTRPFSTAAVDAPCPEGTASLGIQIRIPQAGVPEDDWVEVALGTTTFERDAQNRFYTTTTAQADRVNKPQVIAYNQANGGAGDFPYLMVCRNSSLSPLGHFRTTIHIAGVQSNMTDFSWEIDSPDWTGEGGPAAEATTTTLGATASGADLVLTATVSPADAAGTVTFSEGATTLGSAAVAGGTATFTVPAPAAGSHSYTASFAPTDPAAYETSTATIGVVVAIDSVTGNITVTVPAAPVVDGSLTFSVPFDTPVALVGSRTGDNSRVTASGAFPTVTVTDSRRDALLSGWEVHAQASDFTGSAGTFGAKYLGWTPATPLMTPDAGSPLMVQAGANVESYIDDDTSGGLGANATLAHVMTPGRGVAVLNSTLNLAIPGSTAEGTYTSTVTVTLIAD